MRKLCCLLLCLLGSGLAQELHVIGTGSVVGLYYPVGGAVSFIVNNAEPDLILTVKVTAGSVTNLEALQRGDISFALVQSDVLLEMSSSESSDLPEVQALMGLHAEPLHLVCRKDAGVKELRDIANKRVNVGDEGSGVLETVRAVLSAYRLDETKDFSALHYSPRDAPTLLAQGELDCFFFTVGIGGAAIHATASLIDIDLIALDGPELMGLMRENPYYSFVTVPANTYEGVNQSVTLVGVKAFLVVSSGLPDDLAYRVVKALLDSFETLKQTYPVLETVEKETLLDGLGISLHPGAERAYREAGLLP